MGDKYEGPPLVGMVRRSERAGGLFRQEGDCAKVCVYNPGLRGLECTELENQGSCILGWVWIEMHRLLGAEFDRHAPFFRFELNFAETASESCKPKRICGPRPPSKCSF